MSILNKSQIKGGVNSPPIDKVLKIDIKDTEFLLRLLGNSGISGQDIEQAYVTLTKLKEYHKILLNNKLEI